MKQISKAEYKNYIIQESINSNNNNNNNKPLNEQMQKLFFSAKNHHKSEGDDLNSFFALSTLPSLGIGAIDSVKSKSARSNGNSEEMYLSELLGKSPSNHDADEFKFDLYVPSSNDEKAEVSTALEAYLNGLGLRKSPTSTEQQNTNANDENESEVEDDESSHYITLSSSQVDEHLSYDPERQVYVSQLVLKNAQVKDSGIYVCLGAAGAAAPASSNPSGYTYRKSHLKVIPAIRLPDSLKDRFGGGDQFNLEEDDTTRILPQRPHTQPPSSSSSSFNFQSFGLFIILVPVVLITMFALVSICYLRRLDSKNQTSSSSSTCFLFDSCLRKHGGNGGKKQNQYLCCPTTTLGHMLIPESSSYEPDIEFVKHQIR